MLQTFLKFLKQAASGLDVPHSSSQPAPGLMLAAAGLGSQFGLAGAPPSPAQVAAICISLCSSYQLALDRTQAAADLGLNLLGDPRASVPCRHLQTTLKHHSTTSTSDPLKGQTHQAPETPWSKSCSEGWTRHHWYSAMVTSNSQCLHLVSLGRNHSIDVQIESRLNYNRRVYTALMEREGTLEVPRLGE